MTAPVVTNKTLLQSPDENCTHRVAVIAQDLPSASPPGLVPLPCSLLRRLHQLLPLLLLVVRPVQEGPGVGACVRAKQRLGSWTHTHCRSLKPADANNNTMPATATAHVEVSWSCSYVYPAAVLVLWL